MAPADRLLEGEVFDFDENISVALAVLSVLRALHGVDPETETYRSGQRIVERLVARTFWKKGETTDAGTN